MGKPQLDIKKFVPGCSKCGAQPKFSTRDFNCAPLGNPKVTLLGALVVVCGCNQPVLFSADDDLLALLKKEDCPPKLKWSREKLVWEKAGMMGLKDLKPGMRVTWKCTLKGGYGFLRSVSATVVRVGAKRVTIQPEGAFRPVSVAPENLEPQCV